MYKSPVRVVTQEPTPAPPSNNGTDPGHADAPPAPTEKVKNQMSHAEFFRAAQALNEDRQRFIDERPSKARAAAMLTAMVGFTVSTSAIGRLQEATQVSWKPRVKERKPGKDAKMSTFNALRTLARSVRDLHVKLGEPMSDGLANMLKVIDEQCSH